MLKLFKFLRKNSVSLVYCLALALVPIISSSSISVLAYQYEEAIRAFTLPHWVVFFSLTAFTMAFAITPTTFISILSGYFMGWVCLPFVVLSYLAAAAISFFLSKKIDNGKMLGSLRSYEGAGRVIDNLKNKEFQMVFYSKISPLLPFAFSNFLLSAGGATFKGFMTGSLVGMLPRTIFSVWIGTQAYQLVSISQEGMGFRTQAFISILILISVVGIFRLFRKAFAI